VAGVERVGVLRTVLDGNVTAEAVGGSGAVVLLEVIGHGLDLALGLLGLGLEGVSEVNTVLDTAGGVCAVIDSVLEGLDVPAVDEISMVTIAYVY
jgi:hypothetical protein